jgi:hypothetical protein
MRWGGEGAHGAGLVAGAAGWALFLGIVASDCAMEGIALTDTAAVAPASKLAPGLRTEESAGEDRSILVLIRTEKPAGVQERRELRAAGVQVQAQAGDVITGLVPGRHLEAVAALRFVKYVEPGRSLRPETEGRP